MTRFRFLPSRRWVRSAAAAASSSSSSSHSYPKIWSAPTSYHVYTTEAASSLYCYAWIFVPTTAASSSRVRPPSYSTLAAAAASGAQSEAVASSQSCPTPSPSASGRWGFLPFAAVAALDGCIGGTFATYGPRGLGREVSSMAVPEDDDEYKNMACAKSTKEVSGRSAVLPISEDLEDYSYTRSTSRGGLQLVHLVLRLEGTIGKSTCEVYKELCRKLRVAVGKLSYGSDQCKKIMEALKNALLLVLVPLELVSDFVLYILEEGLKATGIDYLFAWMVVAITGLIGWEVKGTPFRERFVMEQPEDHMAHLALKLIKEHTEATKLLKDNIDMKQEMTDNVIAEHSTRIMALEKVVSQQSDLTKRLEDVVNKIEAVLNGQKAEKPKAPESS